MHEKRKVTEVCFLGTGGSVATEERDNTALLIHASEGLILIDCPGSVIQKMAKAGFNPRDVLSILITHIHPDHIYGLPSLVHSLMMDEMQIDLYGSRETIQFCQKLLDLFRLRDEKIKCRIRFVTLEQEDRFQLTASLRGGAFPVPHNVSSLAFHIQSGQENKNLFYSGDTPIHPPLFKRASGADILIHDCSVPSRYFKEYPQLSSMHTNALDLGRFSQQARIKRLIPVHLFGEVEYSIKEIETEIRHHYTGALTIPHDLMKIRI